MSGRRGYRVPLPWHALAVSNGAHGVAAQRPRLIVRRTGSSSRFHIAPLQSTSRSRLPGLLDARRLPWGLSPSSRHQPSAASTRFPHPAVPSATFHTSSTACSTLGLAGLFRPAATSRVLPSGVFPPAQPHCLVGSRALSPLPTARCPRLPSGATSCRPVLRALFRARIRLRDRRGLAADRTRSPLGLRLLRVFLLEPGERGHRSHRSRSCQCRRRSRLHR